MIRRLCHTAKAVALAFVVLFLAFTPSVGAEEISTQPTEPQTEPPIQRAQSVLGPVSRSGVSVGAFYLSGEPTKLLAGTGTGAGASFEAMSRRGGRTFQFVGRVRLGLALGSAEFTVDNTATGLNYQLVTGDALVGVRVNLMPHENTVLQPYFEIAGKYGLTALLLPSLSGSSDEVTRVNTGKTMGIDWIAGIEFNQRSFVEFQLRGGAGSVGATPEFQVGAAALAFGLLW